MKFEALVERTCSVLKMPYRDAVERVKEHTTTNSTHGSKTIRASQSFQPYLDVTLQTNQLGIWGVQMRPEKISVSTQTTHIDPCPQENFISKLIELITKFLNLCQNSNNLNISGCLTRIAEETFAAPMQTTLNSQNRTVPKTSRRTIKETTQNKLTPSLFNDRNTCDVTDSQL
jgi:hypothetical protein